MVVSVLLSPCGFRIVARGGNANNGANAGLAYVNGNNAVSNANANYGAALNKSQIKIFVPEDHGNRRKINKMRSVGRFLPKIGGIEGFAHLEQTTRHNMVKRVGNISKRAETVDNMKDGFYSYAKHKGKRRKVIWFENHLDTMVKRIVSDLKHGDWKTPEYETQTIKLHKTRVLDKLPIRAHVAQWGYLNFLEKPLCDAYIRRSCSCVKGRGTHDFINMLYHYLYTDGHNILYEAQLDAHHFFQNIMGFLMKDILRRKIKDKKTLVFVEEFIDSHLQGLPLGEKISQIFANFFLSYFDHEACDCFGIAKDTDKMAYWRRRYVDSKIATFRSPDEIKEINKGIQYLNDKFDRLVSEWGKGYFRFADNIVVVSEDKTFLHLICEMIVYKLSSQYLIEVNKDWNVRPIWSGGIDVCGYVVFQDHIRLRKRNKKSLCRQVAKCKKKGLDKEQMRLKCASRVGFAKHADTQNLLKKLGFDMERLRSKKKKTSVFSPFEGMSADQKRPFSELVCHDERLSKRYEVILKDYNILDSRIHFDTIKREVERADGTKETIEEQTPQKCLCIRYEQEGVEYYSYSGSKTLIEIIDEEYGREALPAIVTFLEGKNKRGKKFYTII